MKIGSDKILILDYTYFVNRNIFQKCTINENTINDCNLEFVLNSTSNGYTLQGAYNANSYPWHYSTPTTSIFSDIRYRCCSVFINRFRKY